MADTETPSELIESPPDSDFIPIAADSSFPDTKAPVHPPELLSTPPKLPARTHWTDPQRHAIADLVVLGWHPTQIASHTGTTPQRIETLIESPEVSAIIVRKRARIQNTAAQISMVFAESASRVAKKFVSRALDDNHPKSYESGKYILDTVRPPAVAGSPGAHGHTGDITTNTTIIQNNNQVLTSFDDKLARLTELRTAPSAEAATIDANKYIHSAGDFQTREQQLTTDPTDSPTDAVIIETNPDDDNDTDSPPDDSNTPYTDHDGH